VGLQIEGSGEVEGGKAERSACAMRMAAKLAEGGGQEGQGGGEGGSEGRETVRLWR